MTRATLADIDWESCAVFFQIHRRGVSGEVMKTRSASYIRASISFPTGIYQSLGNLAKRKKVSLAWVVREAAERYVSAETARGEKEPRRIVPATGK